MLTDDIQKLTTDANALFATVGVAIEQTKQLVSDLEAVGIDAKDFFHLSTQGEEGMAKCHAMIATAEEKHATAVNWSALRALIAKAMNNAPQIISTIVAIISVLPK